MESHHHGGSRPFFLLLPCRGHCVRGVGRGAEQVLLQGGVLIEVGAGGGGDQGAGVALGLPLFPGRLDHVPNKARSGYELLYLELRRLK